MSFFSYPFAKTQSNLDFRLLYFTKSKHENDWDSTLHFHPFTEILYVLGGKGKLQLETTALDLCAGELIVINPNTIHTEISDKVNSLEYIFLGIDGIRFNNLSLNCTNDEDKYIKNSFFRISDTKSKFLTIIDTLQNELTQKNSYHDIIVTSLLNVIIITIMRELKLADEKITSMSLNKECAFVKQYIDYHYSDDIKIEDLSKKCFINKYYLIHSFKKQLGITPIQYLIQKRLQDACSLLTTTNHSIAKISNMVGFANPSNFAQAFKKQKHYSPSEYRKNGKKNSDILHSKINADTDCPYPPPPPLRNK